MPPYKLPHQFDETGKPICGAKTKSGTCCKIPPMPNGRCRIHGGSTPVGMVHHNYTDGKYSSILPRRLLAKYNEAVEDPNLLAMNQEIALIDARMSDLLSRVDTGESGQLWGMIRSVLSQVQATDGVEHLVALDQLSQLINHGITDYAAWHGIQELVEQRRKLVESERKRLIDLNQTITAEKAIAMITFILETIKKHEKDTKILQAISYDLRNILGDAPSSPFSRLEPAPIRQEA